MKKILITQQDLTVGGIQRSLINLLNQLDYNKYEVDLILYEKKGDLINEVPPKVNLFYIKEKYNLVKSKKERLLNEIFGGNLYFKNLYKDLKNKKLYDVAIAFNGYCSFSDYYIAFSHAKRKIIWVHSDFHNRKKHQIKFKMKLPSMKKKYKYFDKIVSVSKSAMDSFNKLFPIYKEKNTYIFNFIEETNSEKVLEEPSLVLEKNNYNIVSIGSLLKVKGFDRLIKVQSRLIQNGYNTKIYIMGEGIERKRLERLIKNFNLEENFVLLGNQNNVYPILKQADLLLSSSYYEGLPIALLEGLSCGIPILVPNISGASDIAKFIAPKNSATIVNNSSDGIYEGIIKCMKGPEKNFKFDIKKYNKGVIEKIEKLLN